MEGRLMWRVAPVAGRKSSGLPVSLLHSFVPLSWVVRFLVRWLGLDVFLVTHRFIYVYEIDSSSRSILCVC